MAEDDGFVPPYILRNKGVPIRVYRLDETGERMMTSDAEDADPVESTLHLRFDAAACAEIEEAFDGLRASVVTIDRRTVTDASGEPLVGPDGPVIIETESGREERVFYGLEAFQKAMEVKTTGTTLRVMEIGLGKDRATLSKLLIDGAMAEYQNAVGVAWSIAQGVDPTEAAKVLQRAKAAVAARREALASELSKTTGEAEDETTDSPGKDG